MSNSEDSGALTDTSIANAFYRGADLSSLSVDSLGNALELAVYTEVPTRAPFVAGGIEVTTSWLHIPDGAYVGYQFRALFVTHRATKAEREDIKHYNEWVKFEAEQTYSNPIIRAVASQFKAVVCTAAVDARTNTGMPAAGHAGRADSLAGRRPAASRHAGSPTRIANSTAARGSTPTMAPMSPGTPPIST